MFKKRRLYKKRNILQALPALNIKIRQSKQFRRKFKTIKNIKNKNEHL